MLYYFQCGSKSVQCTPMVANKDMTGRVKQKKIAFFVSGFLNHIFSSAMCRPTASFSSNIYTVK